MTRTDISGRTIPTVRQAGKSAQMVTLARAAEAVRRTGEARFVFGTYARWNIARTAPTTGSYYELRPDGAWLITR